MAVNAVSPNSRSLNTISVRHTNSTHIELGE